MVEPGTGNQRRFSCPYHGWTYNDEGALMGVASAHEFGDIDKSCNGLISLPSLEKEGIIWVTLDPKSNFYIEDYLSGYDKTLSFDWKVGMFFKLGSANGPNWKVAYDGYLDLYHPSCAAHKDTFR